MNKIVRHFFVFITLWAVACVEKPKSNETADLQTPTLETRPSLQLTPTRTRSPYVLDVFTPQAQQAENILVELLPNEDYTDVILHITRNGVESYELSVVSLIGGFSGVGDTRLLSIQDLDLDGEAEIAFRIFLHGAGCCTVLVVVYFDRAINQYQSTNLIYKYWGGSPRMVDIRQDNRPEFVTHAENRIFGVHLFGISQIQIYRYSNGKIVDVTQEYPDLVEQDADFWLASVQKEAISLSDEYLQIMPGHVVPWPELEGIERRAALTAYLEDMYMLGKGEEGRNVVMELCDSEECTQYFESVYPIEHSE